MMEGFIIVSYDIVNDKKRRKLVNVLLNYGHRVQKSVFECNISEKEYTILYSQIVKLNILVEDSVRFYNLCEACVKKIEKLVK